VSDSSMDLTDEALMALARKAFSAACGLPLPRQVTQASSSFELWDDLENGTLVQIGRFHRAVNP